MVRNVAVVLLAAPALFSIPAAAQTDLTVDQIVAKYVEARGGMDKIKAIQSMKTTGKMVMMGGQMEAPFTLQVKRPGSMRMETLLQGKTMVQAFDGEAAWSINPFQGNTEPQKASEDDTKLFRDQADFDGALVDYKTKGHTVELMGKEDVEGTPCYKLKLTRKSGDVEYYYLDAGNFLAVKSTMKRKQMGAEVEMEAFPGNYKPVNGVMMPYSTEMKMGGRTMMQMSIESVEANGKIDDAIFKMPAPAEKKADEAKKP